MKSLPLLMTAALGLPGCVAHMKDATPRTDPAPPSHVPAMSRVAPDFAFHGAQVRSLRGLRGQPVVLVIADSAKTKALYKQMRAIDEFYSDFASRQTVFIAAFREGEGPVPANTPFALANNGAAVASAYGVTADMNIVIIGKDGNVDYQTDKIVPGERIRDVIQNSFQVQAESRKPQ